MQRLIGFLVIVFNIGVSSWASGAEAPASYHLESSPTVQVRASLMTRVETPGMMVSRWAVFMPAPPTISGQDIAASELSVFSAEGNLISRSGGSVQDLSPLRRRMLRTMANATKENGLAAGITIRVDYEATLQSRRLVRGSSPVPVEPLSDEDRQKYLLNTPLCDFQSEPLQRWLTASSLRRGQDATTLEFAYRIFEVMSAQCGYSFMFLSDDLIRRKASSVCTARQSDCAGLSNLFVAAMRANGVPARIIAGRWARSAPPGDFQGQIHVRAEFFVDDIGWVPGDPAFAVSSRDPLSYFGQDPGDLLVMHLGSDFDVDSALLGRKQFTLLQTPAYFAVGKGTMDGSRSISAWQVQQAPTTLPNGSEKTK